jgi:hypothetical protein
VLQKHGKAPVIYEAAHFYRTRPEITFPACMGDDIGIARMLEIGYPGRTFVVIPVGGRLDLPPGVAVGIDPAYRKFDRALKTQVRLVLVSLKRSPFRDFTAEELLGRTLLTCRGPGGCVSVFKGSTLTLGQMADARLLSWRQRQPLYESEAGSIEDTAEALLATQRKLQSLAPHRSRSSLPPGEIHAEPLDDDQSGSYGSLLPKLQEARTGMLEECVYAKTVCASGANWPVRRTSRAETRMLAEHGVELRNQVVAELDHPLIGKEWHARVPFSPNA